MQDTIPGGTLPSPLLLLLPPLLSLRLSKARRPFINQLCRHLRVGCPLHATRSLPVRWSVLLSPLAAPHVGNKYDEICLLNSIVYIDVMTGIVPHCTLLHSFFVNAPGFACTWPLVLEFVAWRLSIVLLKKSCFGNGLSAIPVHILCSINSLFWLHVHAAKDIILLMLNQEGYLERVPDPKRASSPNRIHDKSKQVENYFVKYSIILESTAPQRKIVVNHHHSCKKYACRQTYVVE